MQGVLLFAKAYCKKYFLASGIQVADIFLEPFFEWLIIFCCSCFSFLWIVYDIFKTSFQLPSDDVGSQAQIQLRVNVKAVKFHV